MEQLNLKFDGSAYDPVHDQIRLTGQLQKIFSLMRNGRWMTLPEIEQATGYMSSSISAQLRNLRKEKFGGHTIEKRRRGEPGRGIWEYKLIPKIIDTIPIQFSD